VQRQASKATEMSAPDMGVATIARSVLSWAAVDARLAESVVKLSGRGVRLVGSRRAACRCGPRRREY
jgi:hypothetical protein